MKKISDKHLHYLRNEILINTVIERYLNLPHKFRDSFLRFLCPLCHEFNTATNPATNLARCFRCKKNFNPIDLVMAEKRCSFLEAVSFLQNSALPDDRLTAVLQDR